MSDTATPASKIPWSGEILAVQPRIRLQRSFDQRNHAYLGYLLRIRGRVDDHQREFTIGIGKSAQAKFHFHVGDTAEGMAVPVADARMDPVDYYKVSALRLLARNTQDQPTPPPWLGEPPELEVYRARGHRRLDAQTYQDQCWRCLWGCRMAVEMTLDQWNQAEKDFRVETFCYGPKSCSLYHAGPTRKVPGRRGMEWEEEDWVDEEAVRHRAQDE